MNVMTPEQWARLTPDEQAAHVARFGPPPDDFAQTHPTAPTAPSLRKVLLIMSAVVVVLLLVGGIAGAVLNRSPAPAAAPATAAPASTSTPPPTVAATSPALTAEDEYINDILDTPGLSTTMARSDIIGIGRKACEAIPEAKDHAAFVADLGTSKLGPQVAEVIITAAEKHLCPGAIYGSDLPPAPAGPLITVPPGTYDVGTGPGQVAPGKYKSPGPDSGGACYYARLRHNDGSLNDIIANNLSQGASIVTVKPSDGYLEVSGCTFTKV